MIVNWGDIYEVIYMCPARTVMADAFRRAAGLPTRPTGGKPVAYDRESTYAGVDFEALMGQRYGVRM